MFNLKHLTLLSGKPASIHRHKGAVAEGLFGGDWTQNLLFERNKEHIFAADIASRRQWGNDR
jgi:hypothetical protein